MAEAEESNPQGLAARTVFETGPLANVVCASMGTCTRELVPPVGFEPTTSAFVVPEKRFQRVARHLYRLGYRGRLGFVMDEARSSARALSVSNVSAYSVGR